MSNYSITFKKSAAKELQNLSKKEVVRITALIITLSENPRPSGCKKLKAHRNLWRVRSGNYRIIYTIEDKKLIIEVLQIIDRKDAY